MSLVDRIEMDEGRGGLAAALLGWSRALETEVVSFEAWYDRETNREEASDGQLDE